MPLAAGTRLGVFEILSPLGKGGMGEVYRARDTKLEREVAVKILPEEMAKRPERMARFQREAKLLAAHPPSWNEQEGRNRGTIPSPSGEVKCR